MATTNNITGAEIKSSVYTQQGRDNHDRIFAKRSATEWLCSEEFRGIYIIDPDGWRADDGVLLETPISYKDFCYRLSLSTCSFPDSYFNQFLNV